MYLGGINFVSFGITTIAGTILSFFLFENKEMLSGLSFQIIGRVSVFLMIISIILFSLEKEKKFSYDLTDEINEFNETEQGESDKLQLNK